MHNNSRLYEYRQKMSSTSVIESVIINGTKLYFSISSKQSRKPIILYLHGGPGDACIPLTKKFNSELEDHFIFVNLEQRGSGLSYYKFSPEENLSIDTILADIHQFVLYLLKRLKQDKLIIMGHSWGTVLGLYFIQMYPDLVAQYIGIGQVVNMKKNIALQKAFLRTKMKNTAKLDQLDFVHKPTKASLKLTKMIVAYGGSIYGAKNYRKLIGPFISAKDYSFKDLIHRLQGSKQSIQYFWEELMDVNFENILHFAVPITFCEGRHDHHVSSQLTAEYAAKITSPCNIIWFDHSGHFPQWEEPTKFNQEIIGLLEPQAN